MRNKGRTGRKEEGREKEGGKKRRKKEGIMVTLDR